MDVLRRVPMMCLCLFYAEAGKIYIPPFSRTSGVTRWYLHSDKMCQPDAQNLCEQTYMNGRLLVLESDGIVSFFNQKLQNTTKSRGLAFTVGLYASGNATNQEYRWVTCDMLDRSSLSSSIPWLQNFQCYNYYMIAWTLFGIINNYNYGYFGVRNCSYPYEYACEEITTEQDCDMETIFNTEATSFVRIKEDDCNAMCRQQPNCWGALFTHSVCLLMRNTNDDITTKVTMKRKNCIKDLIETSVVNNSQSCVMTSTECSSPSSVNFLRFETTISSLTSSLPTFTMTTTGSINCTDLMTTVVSYTETFLNETITLTHYETTTTESILVTPSHSDMCTPLVNFVTEELTETVTVTKIGANRSELCTPIVNYTTTELEKKIVEIIKELKVNKSTTNAKLRTLTSAKDDRPSAQTVGVLGLLFITVPFAVIFIADIPKFIQEIRHLFCQENVH